jgi:Major Facilitator Superfamily
MLRLPRRTALEQHQQDQRAGGLDIPGIALFATMLTSLLLFLMNPQTTALPLLALAVAAGAGFAVRERRVADPFVDLRVLAGNVPLVATCARTLLTFIVTYCFLYGFAQWLEDGRGLSASATGLVLIPIFGMGIAVASATGRRPEIRGKLIVGATAQVAACVALLFLQAGTAIWLLLALGLLVGIPQGLNNLANQNALYHQAEPARIGSSAGLLRTFGYLGAIVASAATGVFFGSSADTAGLHHLALFMLTSAVLFLTLTLLDRSLGQVGRGEDTTDTGSVACAPRIALCGPSISRRSKRCNARRIGSRQASGWRSKRACSRPRVASCWCCAPTRCTRWLTWSRLLSGSRWCISLMRRLTRFALRGCRRSGCWRRRTRWNRTSTLDGCAICTGWASSCPIGTSVGWSMM